MVGIESKKIGEGKTANMSLYWSFGDKKVAIYFSSLVGYVYSKKTGKIYVSEYGKSSIYFYSKDGSLLKTIKIPQKNGFQYRGLNRNEKSPSGVSLLYFPVNDEVGNKWGDIEQYELLEANPYVGGFINIYR